MTPKLRRGTAVTYNYAAGKIVSGRVLGDYAKDMPGWYLLELTDEHGPYRGGCHDGQIRVIDIALLFQAARMKEKIVMPPTAARSLNMSAIRSRDTKPEMLVRRGLHAMGFRFRLHDRKLPGRPDLVFAGRKAVIQITERWRTTSRTS